MNFSIIYGTNCKICPYHMAILDIWKIRSYRLMLAICWYSILFYLPGLTSLIQRDELILEFDCSLLYKINDEEDRRNSDMRVIRTKVRMLGRMVAEMQGRTSPAYSLSDMLRPRMFDHVVEAVDVLTN